MKTFGVTTFGCKVNTYDAGMLEEQMRELGLQSLGDGGEDCQVDVRIVNTCAVTEEAIRTAQKFIVQEKRKNPNTKIVVTGCGAQVETAEFEKLSQVDMVIANSHKGRLGVLLNTELAKGDTARAEVFKSNIFLKTDFESQSDGLIESRTRAFLKIQDGCNSFCTFCIIPFARGKSRSLSVEQIVRKVHELEDKGVHEVVISGIHIGDYKDQKGRGLEDLMRSLLKDTSMQRFRISSLEPIEISDELLDIYQDPRMCPHFHMSIQSATSKVLKDMKRKYGEKEVRHSLEKLAVRVPGAFVAMDVIAGFPTETEEDFQITLKCLEETPWTRLHVFPYSERRGTYAARLSHQVPIPERKRRAKVLRELSLKRHFEAAQRQIGSTKRVIVLNNNSGVAEDYWTLDLNGIEKPKGVDKSGSLRAGEITTVRVLSCPSFAEFSKSPKLAGVMV